jgi:hypothetical protein
MATYQVWFSNPQKPESVFGENEKIQAETEEQAKRIYWLAGMRVHSIERIEEETDAEHALDVSCIINAGAM